LLLEADVDSTSRLKFLAKFPRLGSGYGLLKPFGGVALVGFDLLSAMEAETDKLKFIELGEL